MMVGFMVDVGLSGLHRSDLPSDGRVTGWVMGWHGEGPNSVVIPRYRMKYHAERGLVLFSVGLRSVSYPSRGPGQTFMTEVANSNRGRTLHSGP